MDLVENETNHLPLDIIPDILLFQPSKSLLRFKTICKSWNNIISDAEFIINHLQQSRKNNSFLWKPLKSEHYRTAIFENNNKFRIETISGRQNCRSCKDLLCTGDGLALFTACSLETTPYYMLWNPFNNHTARIKCPHQFDQASTTFGICCGPTLNDYKIVATCPSYYSVYSCRDNTWTRKIKFPYRATMYVKEGLLVDGFSFWVMREAFQRPRDWRAVQESLETLIIYFDPRDDKFKKLQKPKTLYTRNFFLISLKGYLCLYDNQSGLPQERLRIWMLRDNSVDDPTNSWTELMIIEDDAAFQGLDREHQGNYWITPLFFTKNNELVIRTGSGEDKIGIYNATKKTFEKLDSFQSSIFSEYAVTAPCVDTLFCPTGQ